jgi:outer membrane protein OmpA-like peptidoglycan-associated protein
MAARDNSWLVQRRATEEHWIPLSDLMTGLMMIFMLISVISIGQVQASSDAMRGVAQSYGQSRQELYQDLSKEFSADLTRWRARLDPDLTIRFEQPEVLFDTGRAELKPSFKAILSDFFPRYVRIISDPKYRRYISEIRIEGHTSSIWGAGTGEDEAYFRNMELSQSRTRSTLEYVLLLPQVAGDKRWLTQHLTANGLSSSRTLRYADGTENVEASQRVEFRVRTDAESRINEILNASAGTASRN